VDKFTRKEMKSDKFALEVQHSVEFVTGHRQQLIRWGVPALAVILLAVGVYLYRSHMRDVRQEALRAAMLVQNAVVGQSANDQTLTFPTADARNQAVIKSWIALANKYPGTDEGNMAHFFLGTTAADMGNLAEAEKQLRLVVDSASAPYASVAKLSLAEVLASENKLPEGEKLVQSVIDHPTILVSKDAASMALAELLKTADRERARKLLEPLRTSTRSAVSKAAIGAYGELTQK
jgi:predicted negative regulator of RcsB-dependent stress response